jgi:hypothetical protein
MNECSMPLSGSAPTTLSLITLEDDIFSIKSLMSPGNRHSKKAISLLEILDGVDLTFHSKPTLGRADSSRKALGRLYSTMPVLKPQRKHSSESLGSSSRTTCADPMENDVFNKIESSYLKIANSLPIQMSPRRVQLLKQASSIPNDISSMSLKKPERKSSCEDLLERSMSLKKPNNPN